MTKCSCVVAALVVAIVFAVVPVFGASGSIPVLSGSSTELTPVALPQGGGLPGPSPACFTQVAVSLSCSSSCIGDKTRYACTATGSGGYGAQWYVFSWTGASPTSGSGDNPNYANRVLTPGGPCQDQIQVSLTDGCSYASDSETIWDYCDSNCRLTP